MPLLLRADRLHVGQQPQKLQHRRFQLFLLLFTAVEIGARALRVVSLVVVLRGRLGEEKGFHIKSLFGILPVAFAADFLDGAGDSIEPDRGRG